MSNLILPSDLGLPDRYKAWRNGQWEAVEQTTCSEKKFVANNGPTGFGKSLYYQAVAAIEGGRNISLTANKTLQDQLKDDFSLVDMRGRSNYSCLAGQKLNCNEGRILGCKDPGCGYLADRDAFLSSDRGLTNYAYFLSSKIHSEGCGKIDVLNCDEAHLIDKEICSAVEIHFDTHKYHFLFDVLGRPPEIGSISEWRAWAATQVEPAKNYLARIKSNESQHRWLTLTDAYVSILQRIGETDDSWLLDQSKPGETIFSPLWPTQYTHKYLFDGIPRVVLVSATLVPKTLSLLNVAPEDCLFLSQPYTFDSSRCPVYLFGAAWVDYKISDSDWAMTINRMDSIIDHRLDRKGLIHTTSYNNKNGSNDVYANSRHRDLMIVPSKASELPAALREFHESRAPRILMSPSISTGYDFPYESAEYQIIVKMPFVDKRPPIMAARCKADPEYAPYLAAQTLIQTCGRIMRAPDDRGETFILDKYAQKFLGRKDRGGFPHLVPDWFLRQIKWPMTHPNPPPSLSLVA